MNKVFCNMKIKIMFVTIIVLISTLVGVVFYFYQKSSEDNRFLTIYGNVDIRQVDLGFRVFGKVKKLFFDEGDVVKPGDLLATLDPVPYQEDLGKSKAQFIESKKILEKSRAKFDKRYLVNQDAISKEDYDDAYYNLEEANANYEYAKSALERSETNLSDTNMLCPTDGVILTRIREPGSVLNPGEPVFTVSIASPVWIRAYISEPDLGKIYFGMPATIISDTKELKIFKGHIGFISPVAEFTPKTVQSLDLRTDLVYRLRVVVDDPEKELKQGMPVTVKLKMK
jgi:HlyD family secretion protein